MTEEKRKFDPIEFLSDIAKGAAMGVAFIIPGFSGGSVAAILGIYEKLINAIANIFKSFRRSIVTLIPIVIGLCIGAVSLLYPIKLGLEYYPFQTVSFFVGLALGGLPSMKDELRGKIKCTNVCAFLIPFILAFALSFLPLGEEVDLFGMNAVGYILLFLIGIVGASALVVPGISGSMLLLIFGYYNPIIRVITDNLFAGKNAGISILILLCCGAGICIGFFGISIIMKHMLSKYRRGTFFAILGFILGSVPTVYSSTAKDASVSALPQDPLFYITCAILLVLGVALSAILVIYSNRKKER